MLPSMLLAVSLSVANPANLDFSKGSLAGWEGEGFTVQKFGSGYLASSAEATGKAILHRTWTLPATASELTFSAALVRPEGTAAGEMLDIVLEGAGRVFAPRQVRIADDWAAAPALLPPDNRRLREYRFNVEKFAGKRVRLALVDSDERPGCYVLATGFKLLTHDERNISQFVREMIQLQQTHNLSKVMRYDSKHFVALSNTSELDSIYRLSNCERLYDDFFTHFRKRGFTVTPPAEKMMVAIFDSQTGFEAYLGRSYGSAVTGLYHKVTNRLVVYDYATNQSFQESKKRLDEAARRGSTDLERLRRSIKFDQLTRDHRDDTNLSTIMHEVAHQLSFNCGLLNRNGDAPVWLAEGLALYCEPTVRGVWQGIGAPNPMRTEILAKQLREGKPFLPLRSLIISDDWIHKPNFVDNVVLGYSQSGALFRLLMQERPKQLKAYLQLIYERKTPDHRLTDFLSVFGDLAKLETRYQAYLRELIRKDVDPTK